MIKRSNFMNKIFWIEGIEKLIKFQWQLLRFLFFNFLFIFSILFI